jgi:hypothetical protein
VRLSIAIRWPTRCDYEMVDFSTRVRSSARRARTDLSRDDRRRGGDVMIVKDPFELDRIVLLWIFYVLPGP